MKNILLLVSISLKTIFRLCVIRYIDWIIEENTEYMWSQAKKSN